jgi:hypothetical protein
MRVWKNEHHLWMNNGVWWIHFVPNHGDLKSVRIRRSLRTNDLTLARYERDEILASIVLTTRGENKKLTTSKSR